MTTPMEKIRASEAFAASVFDDDNECWMFEKTTKLRGVRRLLTQRLWGSYNYHEAARNRPPNPSMRVRTGVRSKRGGSNRGKKVHAQLQEIADASPASVQECYKVLGKKIHPFVVALLQDFHAKGWRLVAAELPVYDEREKLRVGSGVDLVCERISDSKLILLELKVGADNYYTQSSDYMENELSPFKIPNSPLNQALIQLLAYKALFGRCYGSVIDVEKCVEAYFVVFIGPSGVAYEPLTSAMIQKLQLPVIHALSATQFMTAGEKRKQQ